MSGNCCSCNSSGQCVRCKCARKGTAYLNCLPRRNGSCQNIQPNQPTDQTPDSQIDILPNQSSAALNSSLQVDRLPSVTAAHDPTFKWSDKVSGDRFAVTILDAYREVVKWKRNVFLIPSGKVGELFVYETSRLLRAFGESTPLELVVFTAVMVMPHLLLQREHSRSKVKDHMKCPERRLSLWQQGDIPALLLEGRTIQQKLTNTFSGDDHTEKLANHSARNISGKEM